MNEQERIHRIVLAIKAEIAPTAEPPAPRETLEQRDPRADAARAALTTHTTEAHDALEEI